MSDVWMPTLRLKLSREEFATLPRHPAYRYEYSDGFVHVSPWPRYGHAQLDLGRPRTPSHHQADVGLRPVRPDDRDALIPVFAEAFRHLQPFASLDDKALGQASTQCLQRTFDGGDGPLVEAASFVVEQATKLAGAILITLLPGGDPTDSASYHWLGPQPPDLGGQRLGQPHLTWIVVDRFAQGNGLGTLLLENAARVLCQRGYEKLWTTFLVGNDSSQLWHWRNGFELLPHPLSKRRHSHQMSERGGGADSSSGLRPDARHSRT